jgi:inorganic pyrophosphatase
MSLKNVPFGQAKAFNAVVEVPAGGQKKYEYDQEYDAIKLDAMLYDGLKFPFNYGYVPETESGDGEPLDVFILSTQPISRGTVVPTRPVGMIELIDSGKQDYKIIGVPLSETRMENIQDIKDLPPEYERALRDFYEHLPEQRGREMKILGFVGKEQAIKELLRTLNFES